MFDLYILSFNTYRLRVFEKRVLRKIFGPMKDMVTVKWRRLYNKELYTLYSSPNNIWVIKSRRMRWVELVTCMEGRSGAYVVLVGRPSGMNHLEDLGIDGRIILKWIFKKWNGEARTGLFRLSIGTGAVSRECSNEPMRSIKYGEFLDQWKDLLAS